MNTVIVILLKDSDQLNTTKSHTHTQIYGLIFRTSTPKRDFQYRQICQIEELTSHNPQLATIWMAPRQIYTQTDNI